MNHASTRTLTTAAFFVALLAARCGLAAAQEFRGTLTGGVVNPVGALIHAGTPARCPR